LTGIAAETNKARLIPVARVFMAAPFVHVDFLRPFFPEHSNLETEGSLAVDDAAFCVVLHTILVN
jgi:hypothetical protein